MAYRKFIKVMLMEKDHLVKTLEDHNNHIGEEEY